MKYVYEFLAFGAAGGMLTSYAEYKFQYNLFDYTKDAVLAVVGLFKKL